MHRKCCSLFIEFVPLGSPAQSVCVYTSLALQVALVCIYFLINILTVETSSMCCDLKSRRIIFTFSVRFCRRCRIIIIIFQPQNSTCTVPTIYSGIFAQKQIQEIPTSYKPWMVHKPRSLRSLPPLTIKVIRLLMLRYRIISCWFFSVYIIIYLCMAVHKTWFINIVFKSGSYDFKI